MKDKGKYFDKMETAFGVQDKHDNMTDEEKNQFGDMEEVGLESKGVKLGDAEVQAKLTKVQKDSGKDATDYYKSILDKMVKNQKTNVDMPDNTKIERSADNALTKEEFEPKKYNIDDDERKQYYGADMTGYKYDSEGTDRHDEFEDRVDDLNGGDGEETTYGKMKKYGKHYKEYKYGESKDETEEGDYQRPRPIRAITDKKAVKKESVNNSKKQLNEVEPLTMVAGAVGAYLVKQAYGKVKNYLKDKSFVKGDETVEVKGDRGFIAKFTKYKHKKDGETYWGYDTTNTFGDEGHNESFTLFFKEERLGEIKKHIEQTGGLDYNGPADPGYHNDNAGPFKSDHTIERGVKGSTLYVGENTKNRIKKENKNMKYADVIRENIFKANGKLVSKEQVLKLANKVPNRVKIDETVFAVTDGDNSYRLIWEGEKNGKAVITYHKDTKLVSEDMGKMKRLMGFDTNDAISTKKTITENGDDAFKRMYNQVKKKGLKTEARDYPIRRDIGSHEDMTKYGKNTKWSPSMEDEQGKGLYDLYVEKFGPFTVYISGDDSIKIGCLEGKGCYDQTDRAVTREEAAEMLGVESLDQIGEKGLN